MRKQRISEKAVDYILTRTIEELKSLKVGNIAAEIGANRSYLSRSFKVDQKISLSEFILREKMNRAVFILEKEHEKSIEELSLELGFGRKSEFIRQFKSYFAIEPDRYRDLRKQALLFSN